MTLRGASPAAAARAIRETLQRLLSCVTTDVLTSSVNGPLTELYLTTRLSRDNGAPIVLDIEHTCVFVSDSTRPARERWQARIAGYFYTLDAADGREILAYHYHPTGRSHITVPHLHLGAGLGSLVPEMAKAHLLTGLVTPSAVLLPAIEHFGVSTRRRDWATVVEQAHTELDPR